GLGVVLVPVFAFAIFDERLSPIGVAGVALVVLGISALHWHRRRAASALFASGTGWAIVTGFVVAGYSLVDKARVTHLSPLAYIGLMELGAFLVLAPAMLPRCEGVRREWRTNRTAILTAGILSPGAYLLVLFAFQLSKAAYVVAGREVSIVLSALIGSVWMREGHLVQRLAGAAVVAAGGASAGRGGAGGPPPPPTRWAAGSRSPSPVRLTTMEVSMSTRPGNVAIHHAVSR